MELLQEALYEKSESCYIQNYHENTSSSELSQERRTETQKFSNLKTQRVEEISFV